MKVKQQIKWGLVLASAAFGCAMPSVRADDATAPAKVAKPPKHQMDADAILKKMTAKLNLTSDEQDKIKPILADETSQINAAYTDTTLTKAQRKEKARTAMQSANEQIAPLLTSDQQKKFKVHKMKPTAPMPTASTPPAPISNTQTN